jgi:hypothetical protein
MKRFALCIATFGMVAYGSFAEAQNFWWRDTGKFGDWGDHDIGCNRGPEPSSGCNSTHEGKVAVCFNSHPGCGSGTPITWCTYKNRRLSDTPDGNVDGKIWVCERSN